VAVGGCRGGAAGGSRLASDGRAGTLAATRRLPASLRPILGWGERTGQLAEACQLASEMFEGRVQLRAELLRTLLPFGLFLAVGNLALFLLLALYMPMLGLITSLT